MGGGWKSLLISRRKDVQTCVVWNDGQMSTVCTGTKAWTVCLRGPVPFAFLTYSCGAQYKYLIRNSVNSDWDKLEYSQT